MATATSTPAAFARLMNARMSCTVPRFVRRLDQRAEHAVVQIRLLKIADDQLDAERLGPCTQHIDRLREARVRDEELRRTTTVLDPTRLHAMQHRHRLGGGGRLVEQRRVRDLHPGQVGHHV